MKQGIGSFRKLSTVVATAACAVFLVAAGTARAGEMSCASNGEFIRCPLKGADKLGVKMVSQQSDLKCHKDKTWGTDSDGIWVDMGCVATFSYKGGDSSAKAWLKCDWFVFIVRFVNHVLSTSETVRPRLLRYTSPISKSS